MADRKMSDLSAQTSLSSSDIMEIVRSGANYKITVANMEASIASDLGISTGWIAAGETWTYASADSPTFTFTVAADVTTKYSAGMRVKLTQTTVKYFIITAVSTYSGGNTTITVYGGTDYTLANASITSPYYSTEKAPVGFPLSPTKWTQTTTDTSSRSQASPTNATWYNMGSLSLSVPIGSWKLSYSVGAYIVRNAGTYVDMLVSLSTSTSSATIAALTTEIYAAIAEISAAQYAETNILLAAKTTHYLIGQATFNSPSSIAFNGSANTPTTIRAVCAYL